MCTSLILIGGELVCKVAKAKLKQCTNYNSVNRLCMTIYKKNITHEKPAEYEVIIFAKQIYNMTG